MKLTKNKLYELIHEAISNRNMESKWFGPGIQQILDQGNEIYKTEDGDDLDVQWIEQNIGKAMGEGGYSRQAFALHDKPHLVIKFAFPYQKHDGTESNKMEVELFNKYPGVFPKTYMFDREGYEWLIVDRVVPIKSAEAFSEVLSNAFPAVVEAAKHLGEAGYYTTYSSFDTETLRWETKTIPVDALWIFERLLVCFNPEISDSPSEKWYTILKAKSPKNMDKVDLHYMIIEAWEIATNDANLGKFLSVNRELGVDFDEIRLDNVGTNKDKNILVSLDISILKSSFFGGF